MSSTSSLPKRRKLATNGFSDKIVLGTDYSGLETPAIALRKLGLDFRHAFACEKNLTCRKVITHGFSPEIVYPDILDRDVSSTPKVNLYIFGFPCQPYSRAGQQHGINDARAKLLVHNLRYILTHLPIVVLAENVAAFADNIKHNATRQVLVSTLERAGYEVREAIHNTRNWGIPQQRCRWYLLAILSSHVRQRAGGLTLDNMHPTVSCYTEEESLAHSDNQGPALMQIVKRLPADIWKKCPSPDDDKLGYENVMRAYSLVAAGDPRTGTPPTNPFLVALVIDKGCSEKFSHFTRDVCPTLCSSRCKGGGYWCSTKGGPLTAQDMARLSGFNLSDLGLRNKSQSDGTVASKIPVGELKAAVGNCMSVNTLMEILPKVLFLAKIITHDEYTQACDADEAWRSVRQEVLDEEAGIIDEIDERHMAYYHPSLPGKKDS